jgi:hypothetical protein
MSGRQKNSRPRRNVIIRCSHCRSNIQLETFQIHVDHYWHEDQHKWIGIACPTFPQCGHDHTPPNTERTHINARIAGRKRQRSQRGSVPAQQALLMFGDVVAPFPQPPARLPIEDDDDGQLMEGGNKNLPSDHRVQLSRTILRSSRIMNPTSRETYTAGTANHPIGWPTDQATILCPVQRTTCSASSRVTT